MSIVAAPERIYSLNQASTLTGFSLGKFRYNKDTLIEAGVTVSNGGWRIPHTSLTQLGWLGVKAAKGVVAAPSTLELADLRIKELEAEIATLRATQHRGLFRRHK